MEKSSWTETVVETAEDLGWAITIEKNEFCFQKYSPAGQDFNFEIMAEEKGELVEKIAQYHRNYDISEEAYIWLDHTGHGQNGAPYDMKDVYEDMKACKAMVYELYVELEKEEE